MSLKYEPSSEPLHISAKQLFLNSMDLQGWVGSRCHIECPGGEADPCSHQGACVSDGEYSRYVGALYFWAVKASTPGPLEPFVVGLASLVRQTNEQVYNSARALSRSKSDGFVPQPPHVNLRVVVGRPQ